MSTAEERIKQIARVAVAALEQAEKDLQDCEDMQAEGRITVAPDRARIQAAITAIHEIEDEQ